MRQDSKTYRAISSRIHALVDCAEGFVGIFLGERRPSWGIDLCIAEARYWRKKGTKS